MSANNTSPFEWLMNWYRSQCDGDWEHQNGIRIGTLDNPGWWIDIDLSRTGAEGRAKSGILDERSSTDWVFIEATDDMFRARGGPGNLGEMVAEFRQFLGTTPP